MTPAASVTDRLAPWHAWLAPMASGLAAPLGLMLPGLAALVERMTQPESVTAPHAPRLPAPPAPRVPRAHDVARLCVALFDAGPDQAAEQRLVQMALFVLLAQRAGEAGLDFRWGVLQDPSALRSGAGMRPWLEARSATRVDEAHVNAWNAALGALGPGSEVWQIGAPGAPALARCSARVSSTAGSVLQVTLTQGQRSDTLALASPGEQAAARLLRRPFVRTALAHQRRRGADARSLVQFGLEGDWIAVFMQQDGAELHHVPAARAAARKRARRLHAPPGLALVGTILFGHNVARVEQRDGALLFSQFPGEAFGPQRTVALPPPALLDLPSGGQGRLPVFFLRDQAFANVSTRVFMLGHGGQLGCWKVSGADPGASVRFDQLADQVVGAAQSRATLMYARSVGAFTTFHVIDAQDKFPTAAADVPCAARRVLFRVPQQPAQGNWIAAIETGRRHWLLLADCRAPGAAPVELVVADGDTVVGVARAGREPALLVLSADRRTVALHSAGATVKVLDSPVAIAQMMLDPHSDRLCWLDQQHALHVRMLHGGDVLMHAAADGARDAA